MTILSREIERLKQRVLSFGSDVEENLRIAVKALRTRDIALAQKVIDDDARLDSLEVSIEEDCLKILALHQPVASDLRFVIAVIKLDNDLERIGDLSVDLAERAVTLSSSDPLPMPPGLHAMEELVLRMLRLALTSLVNLDVAAASEVRRLDDEVDALHRQSFAHVEELGRLHADRLPDIIQTLSISRYLERIADHATNIAEDVVYLAEGRIVRHLPE